MFETTVKKAIKVPGFDLFHLVGINSKGAVRIGDYITDGNIKYEVTAIPMVCRKAHDLVDEVDIGIRIGNYSIDDIIGKTLYII